MIGRERWRFGTHPSRRNAATCPVGGARTWPALAGLLAAILAGHIDFVPSAGLAIGCALLATLPAWWIYGPLNRRANLRGTQGMIDRACMAFLFAGTWATLAVLLPSVPTILGGPLTVERHDVLSRQAPWQGGLCHALRVEDLGWPAPRTICVSKAIWQASEPGQTMAVRISRSPWGIFVHEMEPVCGGLIEALPVVKAIDVSRPVHLERNLRITDQQAYRLVFRFARAALPFGELREIICTNGPCDEGAPCFSGLPVPVSWSLRHVESGALTAAGNVTTRDAISWSASMAERHIGQFSVPPGTYTLALEIPESVPAWADLRPEIAIYQPGWPASQ